MDKYAKIKKIGEGSFGKAVLVRNRTDSKQYVIKEINISKMQKKERDEARKEVEVLSQLKHPNIVTYRESFEERGNLYIVMDYCDGGDLYQKINQRRGVLFPEDQILDWFVQICLAMKHVHDRKILHRDIKSQNIFLTKGGIIKLGDFGIAKVLNSTVELARTCIGTPYYLSPEICENRPYNNKSDIWSLGCVLYEITTLKHAFEAGNMKNLVLKIIRGSYPPIPSQYSSELRQLISSLFKRSYRERPSINSVLKKSIIRNRIDKFLSKTLLEAEFSHTILHRKNPLKPALPVNAKAIKPAEHNPKPSQHAAVKPSKPDVAAIYGAPIIKKPPQIAKRPAVNKARKDAYEQLQADLAKKRKELVEREKERRLKLMRAKQEKESQKENREEIMRKQQMDILAKQQMARMNKAREAGWRNTLKDYVSPEKKAPIKLDRQVSEGDQPKNAAQAAVQPVKLKEKLEVDKPVSDLPKPTPQQVIQKAEANREIAAKASEKARIVEEFLINKRAAANNRMRAMNDLAVIGKPYKRGADPTPSPSEGLGNIALTKNDQHDKIKPPFEMGPSQYEKKKNIHEMEYLKRLEAIRRQNYLEQKRLRDKANKVLGIEGDEAKKEVAEGDPRFDPDARRKKIDRLRQQAEEGAKLLREQLARRKTDVKVPTKNADKMEKPKNSEKPIEAIKSPIEDKRNNQDPDARPLPALQKRMKEQDVKSILQQPQLDKHSQEQLEDKKKKDIYQAKKLSDIKIAKLEKGKKNGEGKKLGVTRLLRSSSESDLTKMKVSEEEKKINRKKWSKNIPSPQYLAVVRLETTASQMEATQADDEAQKPSQVNKSVKDTIEEGDENNLRRRWQKPGETFIQNLQNATLNVSTTTDTQTSKEELTPTDESSEGKVSIGNQQNKKTLTPLKSQQAWANSANKDETVHPQLPPIHDLEGLAKIEEDITVEEMGFNNDSKYETATNILACTLNIQQGLYDVQAALLRTCSEPDLHKILISEDDSDVINNAGSTSGNEDHDESYSSSDENTIGAHKDILGKEEINLEVMKEVVASPTESNTNEIQNEEDDDEDLDDSDCEAEKDFQSMLKTMQDVLKDDGDDEYSMGEQNQAEKLTINPKEELSNNPKSDDSGSESREDESDTWESDDENLSNGNNGDVNESLFSRLEAMRLSLEEKLGCDQFVTAYQFLQEKHELDDDNTDIGSAYLDEIVHILGEDNKGLFPKILHLVMADAAYFEGNE